VNSLDLAHPSGFHFQGKEHLKKRHHPIHIYLDDQLYFLTAHTYRNQYQLQEKFHKERLLDKIKEFLHDFNFSLYAWVILSSHYHIQFKTSKGKALAKVIGKIHTSYSFEMNKLDNKRGRKIWQNYWDWCIRSEKDFWTHFNYIHHNPLKHGYVQKMEDYEFSSYRHWLNKKGDEWMKSVFEQYPVIDFTIEHDEFYVGRIQHTNK